MIVWVVTADQGQYSDYSKWVVGLALTLDDARIMAEAANPMPAGYDPQMDVILRKRKRGYETHNPPVIPATIEPGVTQVQLGAYYGDWDPIYYTAEAFNLPERT